MTAGRARPAGVQIRKIQQNIRWSMEVKFSQAENRMQIVTSYLVSSITCYSCWYLMFTLPPYVHTSGVLWWACLCVCTCLSVCSWAYLRSYVCSLHQISLRVTYDRGAASAGAQCYVLPVLRMTSCLHIYTVFQKGRHQTRGGNSANSQRIFIFTVRFYSRLQIPPHLICVTSNSSYIFKMWWDFQ